MNARISLKSHPILSFYSDDKEREIKLFKDDVGVLAEHQQEAIQQHFQMMSDNIKLNKIKPKYLTENFKKEAMLCEEKLKKSDFFLERSKNFNFKGEDIQAVFIESSYLVSFIEISPDEGRLIHAVFYKDVLEAFYIKYTHRDGRVSEFIFISKIICPNHYTLEKKLEMAKNIYEYTLLLLSFIKYAPVKIKYLEPKKRIKEVNCKYANDTDATIEIFDETYFTTLIKSEGFNVRGHFRLQPKKKDGEWTKELIWITTFEKHGYTRKAGILKKGGQHDQ